MQEKFNQLEEFTFDVDRGQVLAIVGESGCGKSVTSRASICDLIQGTTR